MYLTACKYSPGWPSKRGRVLRSAAILHRHGCQRRVHKGGRAAHHHLRTYSEGARSQAWGKTLRFRFRSIALKVGDAHFDWPASRTHGQFPRTLTHVWFAGVRSRVRGWFGVGGSDAIGGAQLRPRAGARDCFLLIRTPGRLLHLTQILTDSRPAPTRPQ